VDKISRKDLKKPDEFVSLTKEVLAWLVEQRMALLLGLSALVVVILTAFGWRWYIESQEQEASRLFMEARKITISQQNPEGEQNNPHSGDNSVSENEKYRAAITALEKVKKEFPKTDTAALATFFVGQYSQILGENDKAIESYKEYLAIEGVKGELAPSAIEGIAICFESKGATEQAKENYKRLCEPPLDKECDRGLYHLARLEQASGKFQEASDNLMSILDKYPKTSLGQEIQERLLMLPKPTTKKSGASAQSGPSSSQPSVSSNQK
jgi:tetratricopeptide (TPR) repeat protein